MALFHRQCYQRSISQAYDKTVKPKVSRAGDLVIKKILHFKEDHGKFSPNFEGHYVITKFLPNGTLHLSSMDGDSPHKLINFDLVKRSFV